MLNGDAGRRLGSSCSSRSLRALFIVPGIAVLVACSGVATCAREDLSTRWEHHREERAQLEVKGAEIIKAVVRYREEHGTYPRRPDQLPIQIEPTPYGKWRIALYSAEYGGEEGFSLILGG